MKKILILSIFSILAYSLKAQDLDVTRVLINKTWKPDVEAMKVQMQLRLASLPEMKNLSSKEKEKVVNASIQSVEKLRYEFYDNEEYKISFVGSVENKALGKFSINKIEKKLTLISDGKTKEYLITTITENRIDLKSTNNKLDLILINK